jgi:hypothetical protein
MKSKTESAVLKDASFRNCVSTKIRTLLKSKLFTLRGPISQPLETDVNLAIRPKKIISNILVSIPVTHENKLHVNYFYSFFPFDSEHSDTIIIQGVSKRGL